MPPAAARTRHPIRVSIGDVHPLFRDALARAIRTERDLELASEAADPLEALDDVERLRPDVAVVDPSGLAHAEDEFFVRIRQRAAPTRVVLLVARPNDAVAFRAVAGGVAAVLGKSLDATQLCRAVVAVSRGQSVLSPEAQHAIAAELRARHVERRFRLTEREHQALAGVAAGRSARQIGLDLHLGTATVKTYLARAYAKLGVSERAAAVAQAMRDGLLD